MQQSFWLAGSATTAFPRLAQDVDVDVAVIGAGLAGLSAAWELAATGRSVVVLEARRVGSGVSGHTTAKVTALQGGRYGSLEKRFGLDVARHYAESQVLAVHHLAGLVDRLGIDCALERRPAYVFVEDPDDRDLLTSEAQTASQAGLEVRLVDDPGLPFPTAGAVRLDEQLMFHPVRYLRSLADRISERGGMLHEETPVVSLEEGGRPTVVTAGGHRVRAGDVVVASHLPVFDRSLLFARVHPSREFVLARPVATDHDPPGMYVSLDRNTRSVRSAPMDGGRLLIVSGFPFVPGSAGTKGRLEDLRRWAVTRFGEGDFSYTWAAQDNHTSDGLPFIGPLHPFAKGVWVATGFGGWGMTNSILSGILLRDLVEGHEPGWARIFHTRRLQPLAEARSLARQARRTGSRWVAARVSAKVNEYASVEDVPPGEASIVDDDAGQWAVLAEPDGARHVVSAVCSHLGCLVGFNEVERTWECPCHGSRFTPDGEVLQGPAATPLRRHPDASD